MGFRLCKVKENATAKKNDVKKLLIIICAIKSLNNTISAFKEVIPVFNNEMQFRSQK